MNNVHIDLSPKQMEGLKALANNSPIRVLGYGGAKGGGKSHLARQWLYLRAKKYPGSTGLLVRKTYQELYRNHTKRFISDFPDLHYVERKNHLELDNGSVIELAYCEGERDLERFQGAEYHSVVVDQAEQHIKQVFYYLRSCMRTTMPNLETKMLLTFNPGGIGHTWLKRMFVDGQIDHTDPLPEELQFILAKVFDNKWIMENDAQYVKNLEALPEGMREAYLNGSFDTFEGQFFQLKADSMEDPFDVPEEDAMAGRLFGSLDHGITHPTSFGLWYLDHDNNMHRLFTYFNNGATAYEHAKEIHDLIEAFTWTKGQFPHNIYFDPSMATKQRLSPSATGSFIDEYKKVFGHKTTFKEANNNKVHGCMLMRQVLHGTHGFPSLFYWPAYNQSFVDGMKSVITDQNNREIYKKMDGDDIADEVRYGVVAGYASSRGNSSRKKNHDYMNRRMAGMREKSYMEI